MTCRTLAEVINFLGLGVVTSDPPDAARRRIARCPRHEGTTASTSSSLINGPRGQRPALRHQTRFDQAAAGVPIDLVDHIEMVVGPGSVLYGSNAMMGVINVITKSATELRGRQRLRPKWASVPPSWARRAPASSSSCWGRRARSRPASSTTSARSIRRSRRRPSRPL